MYESPQKDFFLFSWKLRCHKKCTNLQIATEILSGCSQLQPLVPILEETYSKQGIAMGASSLLSWARLAAPCRDCRGRSCRARWGSPPSPQWSSPSWWRPWQATRELLKIGWCPVSLQSKIFSWIEWCWKIARSRLLIKRTFTISTFFFSYNSMFIPVLNSSVPIVVRPFNETVLSWNLYIATSYFDFLNNSLIIKSLINHY